MQTSIEPIRRRTSSRQRVTALRCLLLMSAVCLMCLSIAGCGSETTTPPTTTSPTMIPNEAARDLSAIDVDDQGATSEAFPVVIEITAPGGQSESESDAAANTAAAKSSYRHSFDVVPGTTLEQVMRKMAQPEVVISGSGVTAFVQSIDGIATTSNRGWTFSIDGQFANEGIGSTELTRPQTVRWRFTTFEEAMSP